MMNQEHKRPVSLEDLLRLKRAERPPVEFWNQFDRELRAKQLAAIVEKRPWWRTVPHVFGSLSRYHLPLGATAILALTVVTVREYRSAVPQPAAEAMTTVAATVSAPSASRHEGTVVRDVPPVSAAIGSAAAAAENDSATDSTNSALATATPGQLLQVIPMLGTAPQESSEVTPTARFIATNLALAKATEPAVAQNLLGASHGFETRGIPARTSVAEPLARMTSPSDARRSRLLNGAAMAVSMNTATQVRPSEFRARRISDEQLYDTVSRIDAHGNSFGVKF